MAQNDGSEKRSRSRPEDKNCVSHGQTAEHETLRLFIRVRQISLEEVEETILRAGSGVPIYVCYVQLQGKEVGTIGDDAVGWLHSGLHRSCEW